MCEVACCAPRRLAGGPTGKVELIEGYTPVAVFLQSPAEGPRLAASLRETIASWCDARWEIEHDEKLLRVSVPMHRNEGLPFHVAMGHL